MVNGSIKTIFGMFFRDKIAATAPLACLAAFLWFSLKIQPKYLLLTTRN